MDSKRRERERESRERNKCVRMCALPSFYKSKDLQEKLSTSAEEVQGLQSSLDHTVSEFSSFKKEKEEQVVELEKSLEVVIQN